MNLYIFNQTRRGSVFGVGTYIRELTTVLKNHGINLCVVNLISEKPQIETKQVDGIEHLFLPLAISDHRTISNKKQWELYYRNVVYILQLYIKDKKDLIFHMNFYESDKLIDELKNIFDCKIVAVSHFFSWGFTIYDNLQRLRRILQNEQPNSFEENLQKVFEEERIFYVKVDHIICLSNYMKQILCKDYGIDVTKISVIPNGLCDLVETSISIKYLRNKWNIPLDEKVIIFAGRIDEVKGITYLIKAFHVVVEKYPKARLIIAGSGDYDIYLQEAKRVCSKISFTGLLTKNDLYELYRIAEIGVVPSLFEPFGYVAVEMMIHALPLVVTSTSGLNEVVDHTCGLKISLMELPDRLEIDASFLAQKILYLLQHSAKAKDIGLNGRKRYLTNYSSEIFCQNMLHLYSSL